MSPINKSDKIFVAGHRGLVGSAIYRQLQQKGYTNIVTRSRSELDLSNQANVDAFFDEIRPDCVILAAAKVGGILANDTYPADFISDNIAIQTNVIRAAHSYNTKRLIFLGSSCIYPKLAEQPLREDCLLTGPLEPTNEWYAVAKIAGIKMCQAYKKQHGHDFFSLMPTNLYGPNDNFDLKTSHVLPALIRKFHEAKSSHGAEDAPVTLWGSGTPKREFLYVDDMADATVFAMEQPSDKIFDVAPDGILNIGVGEDIAISELAELIKSVLNSKSEIVYDTSKPDGTPRKLMDVTRINKLGWNAKISLEEGIQRSHQWFCENYLSTT
ncbi:MAG: GDP-L-fucose synthase [Rhodothermaceae bacterium]|nr:GDP-L-fucose synthase [Rhodothermaceae bacterium]